ncbi:DUF1697 domain-containing protein [Tamlana crocina]|uniref:DUF1697 domain-containing protein n=1 Tax=Tamlana crocina TaxID=393006 RepID=A0ABX1DA54_9FLAO|nr:DUF1697 domain-containing protein [Tamlana crocina]NJX15263.1 DUF1697 domain-containing protein [Tamlana crocina]
MTTYIALLRGINVGGQKKVPMADLRGLLSKMGLKNVKTYIQSGNVVFQSSEEDIRILENEIRSAILKHFSFEVPVLVKASADFKNILNDCPFPEAMKLNSYFVLLFSKPNDKAVEAVKSMTYPNETFVITDACVYLHCAQGYGKAKLNNNTFERKLNITSTARNYKTMTKLLTLASGE